MNIVLFRHNKDAAGLDKKTVRAHEPNTMVYHSSNELMCQESSIQGLGAYGGPREKIETTINPGACS